METVYTHAAPSARPRAAALAGGFGSWPTASVRLGHRTTPRVERNKGIKDGLNLASATMSHRPMTADRRNPQRTPSQADPDGALERLLQRRHLKFQEGDVIITRQAGGLRAESRAVYHLHVHGSGPLPDRFASFEHAAAKG